MDKTVIRGVYDSPEEEYAKKNGANVPGFSAERLGGTSTAAKTRFVWLPPIPSMMAATKAEYTIYVSRITGNRTYVRKSSLQAFPPAVVWAASSTRTFRKTSL